MCLQASEYHSHKWTVYVRGVNNEDISHIVQKVQPQQHGTGLSAYILLLHGTAAVMHLQRKCNVANGITDSKQDQSYDNRKTVKCCNVLKQLVRLGLWLRAQQHLLHLINLLLYSLMLLVAVAAGDLQPAQ